MKITNTETITQIINDLRDNSKIVFMSGAFDLFHYAHFIALKKASTLGNIFIVQIDSNQLVKRRKGQDRPYLHENIRAEIVSSLEFVNYVFISNIPSEDPTIIGHIKPNIYIRPIITSESESQRTIREDNLHKIIPQSKIVWLPQTSEISTTKIIPILPKSNISNL